jgi:hypothetical protein
MARYLGAKTFHDSSDKFRIAAASLSESVDVQDLRPHRAKTVVCTRRSVRVFVARTHEAVACIIQAVQVCGSIT